MDNCFDGQTCEDLSSGAIGENRRNFSTFKPTGSKDGGFDLSGFQARSLGKRSLPAEQAQLALRASEYLADSSADAEQVRRCLDALDEDGLRPFNYDYYYLNLLALFGDHRPADEIRATALACARERLWASWTHLVDAAELSAKTLLGEALPTHLMGWDRQRLTTLMQAGRGLIVCTCHYGGYRYILDDLLSFGLHITFGLDADSAYGFRRRCRSIDHFNAGGERGEDPIMIGRGSVRIVDVERSRLATITLMKALRRNEIVLLFADGNCGLDGPQGTINKAVLSFFNYQISLKAGISHLAVALGAPILPVFSLRSVTEAHGARSPVRGMVSCEAPIIPITEDSFDRREFEAKCMTSIFRRLSDHILMDPTQWESAHMLHRWRTTATLGSPKEPTGDEVGDDIFYRSLFGGGRLRLNHQIVASIPTPEGTMLASTESLRVFRMARHLEWLLQSLKGFGVSAKWLETQGLSHIDHQEAMRCLMRLASLRLIEFC